MSGVRSRRQRNTGKWCHTENPTSPLRETTTPISDQHLNHLKEGNILERIQQNCIIPSAAYSVPRRLIKQYAVLPERCPCVGDLVFGEVASLGFHVTMENASARIHTIHDRTRSVFVFGARYAPDHFEGVVPAEPVVEVDMLARSGVVGQVRHQNERISMPTRIRVLGFICDSEGKVVNSRDHVLVKPKQRKLAGKRARLILCVGTSMNSGKSYAAAACCYALSSMGRKVRAGKVTGTASLKDILLMQDTGAQHVADFSYFGFPSTYLLAEEDLLRIFDDIDMKYGNNPRNYLVMEFADGIFQRETALLLQHPHVQERIHRLIFCAADAAGVMGGLSVLQTTFDLVPDAISGLCSSSPLAIQEIASISSIPILRSMERDFRSIFELIR